MGPVMLITWDSLRPTALVGFDAVLDKMQSMQASKDVKLGQLTLSWRLKSCIMTQFCV